MYVCMYVCKNVCMYVCVYVCSMFVYVCCILIAPRRFEAQPPLPTIFIKIICNSVILLTVNGLCRIKQAPLNKCQCPSVTVNKNVLPCFCMHVFASQSNGRCVQRTTICNECDFPVGFSPFLPADRIHDIQKLRSCSVIFTTGTVEVSTKSM